jgi:hypothetical protein
MRSATPGTALALVEHALRRPQGLLLYILRAPGDRRMLSEGEPLDREARVDGAGPYGPRVLAAKKKWRQEHIGCWRER